MIALEMEGGGDEVVLDDDRWRWRHTVSYWVGRSNFDPRLTALDSFNGHDETKV